jgi:hypothetical protein
VLLVLAGELLLLVDPALYEPEAEPEPLAEPLMLLELLFCVL